MSDTVKIVLIVVAALLVARCALHDHCLDQYGNNPYYAASCEGWPLGFNIR